MNYQMSRSTFDGIQALRFLAAIMVVVTHAFLYTSERLGVGAVMWSTGAKGVDIFFVISGFVMVLSSRSLIHMFDGWKTFLTKRVIRIVPLYWTATTLKLVVLLLTSGLVLHADMNWWTITKSYFFVPSINIDGDIRPFLSVGWTLIFELFFYIVFALALLLKQNIYRFVGLVLLIFSVASLFRASNHSPWLYLFDPIILEFYFGMLLGYFALQNRYLSSRVAVVAFFIALAYLFGSPNSFALPRMLDSGIPAALLVWAAISLEPYLQGKIPRFILFFGAASYSLYLFHPLIAPLAPTVLNKVGIRNIPLSILSSITLAMTAAAMIYRWYEKPLTDLLSGRILSAKKSDVSPKEATEPAVAEAIVLPTQRSAPR